jgi:alkylated DNA repair dioxygenase AlkB
VLGLKVIPDFISVEEESEILSKLNPHKSTDRKERNSIERYGSNLPYNSSMVSSSIPDFLDKISMKIVEAGILNAKPDSVTINEYLIGQKIGPHIDSSTSGPIITILSLCSPATMKFSRKKESFEIHFPARAIVQMRGEIRELWQHSIAPVEEVRYSLVFRHGTPRSSKKK